MSWYSDGTGDQYLTIANDARVRYADTDHCFGMWFYRTGDSGNSGGGVLFDQFASPSGRHWLYIFDSTEGANANKMRNSYIPSNGDAVNRFDIYWDGPVLNNQWYHVLLQRSGITQTIYIDGVAVASDSDVSTVAAADPNGVLRLLESNQTDAFRGYLAEWFKFGRALTSQEITDIAGGMRPDQLQAAGTYLEAFIPMDSGQFRDYHNRLTITNVGPVVEYELHPPVYDPRPTILTYREQSTKNVVQFTDNLELDVTKETPYGIHAVKTDSISNAVNWCLKYQREPDPDARVPAGGPVGCFVPKVPACGYDDYWLADEPFFNPNKWGNALIGSRVSANPDDVYGPNSNGASRIKFSLTNKSIPCIINSGHQFVLENLAIMADTTEQVGILNHKLVVNESGTLTTRTSDSAGVITLSSGVSGQGPVTGERLQVRWSGGARYDMVVSAIGGSSTIYTLSGGSGDVLPSQGTAVSVYDWCYVPTNAEGYGTGVDGTQPCSRLQCTNTIWDGFSVAAMQNGGYANVSNCDHHTMIKTYFNNCARGWYNINDQGVDIEFFVVEFRGAGTKVFDFQAGGFMAARQLLSAYSNSILLNIGLGGKLKTGPGKNNGYFKLTDVKTDTEATSGAYIVYMEGTNLDRWCKVVIEGGANSRRANDLATTEAKNKFMRIVGRCQLTIRDLDFPGQIEVVGNSSSGAYSPAVFSPGILLDNCQLLSGDAADLTRIIIGDTPNYVHLSNCFENRGATDGVNRPLPVDDLPDKPTVTEMDDAIDVADYTTPAEAQALIDAADYTTPAEAQALVDAVDWTINLPSGSITAISITGDSATSTLPKVGQPRVLNLNVAGIAAQSGNTVSDITQVRVRINRRRTTETVYNVSSIVKDSGDPATAVSLPSSTGVVTVSITVSDFGTNKLEAGWNYYVIPEVLIAGTWRESDVPQRLMFTYDQVS